MATRVTVTMPLPERLAVLSLLAKAAGDARVPLRDWVPLREAIERIYAGQPIESREAEPHPAATASARYLREEIYRGGDGSTGTTSHTSASAAPSSEPAPLACLPSPEAGSSLVGLAEAVLRLHPADITTPRCEWCAVAELAAEILGRPTARVRRVG